MHRAGVWRLLGAIGPTAPPSGAMPLRMTAAMRWTTSRLSMKIHPVSAGSSPGRRKATCLSKAKRVKAPRIDSVDELSAGVFKDPANPGAAQTALLVLAEEHDRVAYMRWLRAQGIIYRSMDGPVIVDAMRRVARGELFIQKRSSDIRKGRPEVARGRTESRNRIPVILSVDENAATLYARYKVLQRAGYGVVNATDGEQALNMFEATCIGPSIPGEPPSISCCQRFATPMLPSACFARHSAIDPIPSLE